MISESMVDPLRALTFRAQITSIVGIRPSPEFWPLRMGRAFVLALVFSTTSALSAEQFSVSDYDQWRQEEMLANWREYSGIIQGVIANETGAVIRLRAKQITETRRQKSASEKAPHPGAETYEMFDVSTGDKPPKVWKWTRDASSTTDFRWRKEDGPVPVATGMEATISTDLQGKLVDISYVAAITHWRRRENGFVEVVLGCDAGGKPPKMQLLYLRPARMAAGDGGMNIHWTRKWGLLITVDAAGPDAVEAEPPVSARPGLTLANAPEMQIWPGRDGWHALPSLGVYSDEREAKDSQTKERAFKAWKKLRRAIPSAQYMEAAG